MANETPSHGVPHEQRQGSQRTLLVIGGGLAGIAAATEGAKQGANVTIVEATDALGGALRSETIDDTLLECGPDGFVAMRPDMTELVRDLGAEDNIVSAAPGTTAIYRDGRLHPVPARMGLVLPTSWTSFLLTSLLTWPEKVRALADAIRPQPLPEADTAVGNVIRERLGHGATHFLALPLISTLHGMHIDDLSLDAGLPELRTALQTHGSLSLSALWHDRGGHILRSSTTPTKGRRHSDGRRATWRGSAARTSAKVPSPRQVQTPIAEPVSATATQAPTPAKTLGQYRPHPDTPTTRPTPPTTRRSALRTGKPRHGGSLPTRTVSALRTDAAYMAEDVSRKVLSWWEERRSPGASSPFRTLRGGMGALGELAKDAFSGLGVNVLTNTSAVKLAAAPGPVPGMVATLLDAEGEERTSHFDAVVLTTPPHISADIVDEAAPNSASALRDLPRGHCVVVALTCDEGYLHPLGEVVSWCEPVAAPVGEVTLMHRKWPGSAPKGTASLRFVLPPRAGSITSASDEKIEQAVVAYLERRVGAPLTSRGFVRITRWPNTMPLYTIGHKDRVHAIEAGTSHLPRLALTGSWVGGTTLAHIVATARARTRDVLS